MVDHKRTEHNIGHSLFLKVYLTRRDWSVTRSMRRNSRVGYWKETLLILNIFNRHHL